MPVRKCNVYVRSLFARICQIYEFEYVCAASLATNTRTRSGDDHLDDEHVSVLYTLYIYIYIYVHTHNVYMYMLRVI